MKIVLLGILSLLDLVLTLNLGFSVEANPFWLFVGEDYFILGKILITLIACLTFLFTGSYKISKFGLNLAVMTYILITLWHLTILISLLF